MNSVLVNNIIKRLIRLDRATKKLLLILIDSIVIIVVLLVSISVRLGFFYWPKDDIFLVVFGAPILAIPIFISFGLYKSIIRHIGLNTFFVIFRAVTMYALAWGIIDYMISIEGIQYVQGVPRSVILINWILSFGAIGGLRIIAQQILLYESLPNIKNVIIYGAGEPGIQLSKALKSSKEYKHVVYLDDNNALEGSYIDGLRVFSPKKIERLLEKYNIKEILLALPSSSRNERKVIIESLSNLPVSIRSLPSVSEITEGKVKIDELLEIKIEDLLGRDHIKPNLELLKVNITTKVVLVTGAGGSIGSELCRQIILLKPKKLIMFDISESSLYLIQQELSSTNIDQVEVISLLGSVISFDRLKNILTEYGVQTVYHAAAYKHVPLVESNQSEGVLNNIIGTMNAAKAAIQSNVETFVLISTDKAVRPTNTMGATKRVSELVLQALSKNNHNTCLTMVRFGNVLDSSGSVVPLFKKQIKEGGPITVTDANVVRYFMTIPEAVELVIQAGAMAQGGDVFLLDMGKPVLIYDLALKMIHLSGLKPLDGNNPNGDIEIIYTGLRPGEKLYEELLVGDNSFRTENKLIMRAEENFLDWDQLEPMINELKVASINFDNIQIRDCLIKIVPEFAPLFPLKETLIPNQKVKINK
jgi:FlaA1/EpsC-like NDP-sugar epimerase